MIDVGRGPVVQGCKTLFLQPAGQLLHEGGHMLATQFGVHHEAAEGQATVADADVTFCWCTVTGFPATGRVFPVRRQDGHDFALPVAAADDDRGILEAVGMVVHVRALEQEHAISAFSDELVPGRSVDGGIGVDAEHAAHGEGRWPSPGDGPGDGADHGTAAVQRAVRAGRHGPLPDQRWCSVQSAASGDASWRHGVPCRRRFCPRGIPCVLAGAGSGAHGFTLVQLFQFFTNTCCEKHCS